MKMKKLAAALCAAALSLTAISFSAFAADTGVAINEKNFPDEKFRIGMQEAFDTNDDNVFSDDEINKTTHISCGWSGIKDLKGIEYFTELIGFSCSSNQITELDMSANKKLKTLHCYTLSLEKPLDLSKNTSLEILHCGQSGITELDVSNNKELYLLNCSYNDITQLDISQNAKLKELDCILTDISELDISNNPYLLKAYTEGRKEEHTDNDTVNDIIEDTVYYIYDGDPDSDENEDYYDLRVNSEVKIITEKADTDGVAIDEKNFPDDDFSAYVSEKFDTDNDGKLSANEINAVDSIDVSESGISSLKGIEYFTQLTDLRCDECPLTTLDLRKNTQLESVMCQGCGLKELYVSGLAKLDGMLCSGNKLSTLDLSGCTSLKLLYCQNNELTSIDIKDCAALDEMECGLNKLTSLDISGCPELRMLHSQNNALKELDVSGSHLLDEAYKMCCYYNHEGSGASLEDTYAEGALHYNYLPYAGGGCFSADKDVTIITNKNVTIANKESNVSATGELCSEPLDLVVTKTEVKNAELAFDITLKGRTTNSPVLQPHGEITISIPCETKGLYVYHIKDDGTKEYIEAKYVDGCYVFTTDHLSVYALMKDKPEEKPETKPETKPENKPSTGDTKPADDSNKPTGSAAGIAFAGITLAGAAIMVSKKRK